MHSIAAIDELRTALNKVLTVVDKKSSRPILTYALFEIKDNQIRISATDLEVSIKVAIDAEVETAGDFCVNAKNLFDILRELPDGKLDLSMDEAENILKLTCGDIHYSLLIYKNDDFPHLSFNTSGQVFKINAQKLSEVINKTSHAISLDETRLHLNGIFLQLVDSKLRAVATDGHRLALYDLEIESLENEHLVNGIIVPRKGVYELKKIADSYPDEELSVSVDEAFMNVVAGNKYFLSIRLIAREYPKYQAVIPNKTSFDLTIDKAMLTDSVKRIKIMSNEKSNGVRIGVGPHEMVLTANHPSLGNAQEKLPIDYSGKEMEIGFNARYLVDALSVFNDGEIVLKLNNELSPVLVTSNQTEDFMSIIMPLKL